jgi:hypothetical protein
MKENVKNLTSMDVMEMEIDSQTNQFVNKLVEMMDLKSKLQMIWDIDTELKFKNLNFML